MKCSPLYTLTTLLPTWQHTARSFTTSVRHMSRNEALWSVMTSGGRAFSCSSWCCSRQKATSLGKRDVSPSAPGFLPKTCRRGRPRSWPSQPEWTAGKGKQRASWEASYSALTAALYGIPRNSHRFLAGTGDADPCQMCKSATEVLGVGGEKGALLSFSCPLFFLSLTALVALSHLSSLPRQLVLPPPLLVLSLPHSLLLSLTLPPPTLPLKCGNFIPWMKKWGVGGV